jgi:hypothetical protein
MFQNSETSGGLSSIEMQNVFVLAAQSLAVIVNAGVGVDDLTG